MDLEYCPYCMAPVKPGEPCGTCRLTAGSYTPAARHLPPGTVLQGRYLLGRVLGEGGFGITYIGRDLVLGLKVAVKEYFPADKATRDTGISAEVSSYMGNSSSLYLRGKANFLREAQTIARLDRQPNIVSVKDFFEANNTAYIVMEYIDGTTFKDLVDQRGGKLPAWELLHLIEPMFGALSAMHDLGLIHRDISPENLMLEQGTVRLLDFGCARESANGDATMTIMLRHGYAPLEQYQSSSEGQGPWTDIYALSATIYYCITGKKPPQSMDRLLEDKLTPPRKLGVDLSERQEKALLKGLSVLPRTRFQSAEEFHTALYEGEPPSPPPPAPDDADDADAPNGADVPDTPDAPGDAGAPDNTGNPGDAGLANKLLAWLKEHRKAVGVGAAALLAVVVIGAAIAAGVSPIGPDPAASDPVSTGPDVTGPPDSSAEVAAPAYVYNWDLDLFEKLMNDGSVSAIIIPEGHGLGIDRPMEITKPVQMGAGAQLNINAEVTLSSALSVSQTADVCNNDCLTVSGEGRIEVYGHYGGDGLLRTVDGGSIRIGDTGWADFSVLWLEQTGDLDADSSHFSMDQIRYIVADEDALFANAAHVSTFAEFENAVNDRRTESVVVDGSIEVEYWFTANKPILISEGAGLTTRFEQSGIKFGGVAVNRGRVEGEIQFSEGGVYLNYGSSDVSLWTEGTSTILNLGELRFRWGTSRYSAIINIGHMILERGSHGETLGITSGCLHNLGDIDLVSGHLELQLGSWLNNLGTIRVSADALIANSSSLYTSGGKLVLEGDLWNHGGRLIFDWMADNLEFQGGSIEGGMIQTMERRSKLEKTGNFRDAAILVWRNAWEDGLNVTEVESAQVLLSKVEYTKTQKLILRVTGDVFVDGDLTIPTHNLVVEGSLEVTGRLIMDGGVVQNHGVLGVGSLELQNGAFLNNYRELNVAALTLRDSDAVNYSDADLDGGQLKLYNARLYNQGNIRHMGVVRIDGGSYLDNWTNMELQENAGIDVAGGVFSSNWMEVGVSVSVSDGGWVYLVNGAHIFNGAGITVAHSAGLTINGETHMDGGTKLVNDGHFGYNSMGESSFHMDGEIVNRSDGYVWLGGNPININGAFRSEGEVDICWGTLYISGELNNRGTAHTDGSGNPVTIQGNWTGKALEYR